MKYLFTDFVKRNFSLVLGCVLIVSCSDSATSADPVEKFTGAHTRVVWIQEQGEGADSYAFGDNFKLVGFDSRDGKKERYLLDEIGNFYKPILTPDGKKVVVSSRSKHEIYLVDFKRGKKKLLGKGVAVDVWDDPATGKTWVYAVSGDGHENKYMTTRPLIRFPLTNPQKRQPVWSKTHLSWSNLDISRNGKLAGGLFPWPHAGIAKLGENTWKKYGKGCWTALSPDNSAVLWVFDGLHRNLNFVNPATSSSWITNINGAPGIDGYEVYHPRWSNHVQFMTLTGPYVEGEGGNKISGGGGRVEIYIGKFSADLKKVEAWLQLSHNLKADIYPDVWIANGSKSTLAGVSPTAQVVLGNDSVKEWPGNQNNLLFLWETMKSENRLAESGILGFQQLNVSPIARARYNRFLEMDLQGAGFVADLPTKLVSSVIRNNQTLGIECLYTPKTVNQEVNGIILQLGVKGSSSIIKISQKAKTLVVQSGVQESRTRISVADRFHVLRPEHIFISLSDQLLKVYVNGNLVQSEKVVSNTLSNWQDAQLTFGSNSSSEAGLQGSLSHVALHANLLTDVEIAKQAQMVTGGIEKRQVVETITFDGTLIEASKIPEPDALGAYSRALVVNRYKVDTATLSGEYTQKEILVAQWAVLDRKILPEAARYTVGAKRNLQVQSFDSHPELEGERLMMDMFDPDLEIYYQVN